MYNNGFIPIIAVIDTGIDYSCTYFKDIMGGVAFLVEDNKIFMSDEYSDEVGHGTQVCSIIKRYCSNALFYIIKIYGYEQKTSSLLLLQALEHLLDKDVDFVNLSLAVNSKTNIVDISRILDKLSKQGKIIISSVKNRSSQSFPANYSSCYGVLGVNDIREGDYLFDESCTVQIRSNGTPEYVETLNAKFEWFYGNSKAAACMTGQMASLMQMYCYNMKERTMKSVNSMLSKYQNRKGRLGMDIIAKLINVCRNYGEGETMVRALDKVNLEIKRGEFIAVTGASGSGKSTLLNVMGGLDTPTDGVVMIDGMELGKLDDEKLTVFRREKIGFVFQNFNLISMMTVYENIVLPIQIGGNKEDVEYVKKIIDLLGLSGLENRLPSQLSGGQQQRVAIARALASKPALILADEPTGNLDSVSSNDVISCFKKSVAEFEQTVVMITHNDVIANTCNRILTMKDGILTEGRN